MDITVSFSSGKRVDAHFEGFTVKTDQPPALGGAGAEAAPYELFLASMATCAGIFALGFCQARGLSTEGLSLVQHNTFDPVSHLVTEVRYTLTLPNTFPEKYRGAIVKAVENCKVKKSLAQPPTFAVTVAPSPDTLGDQV
ncbi:MAG: OsmC family protein [Myxococcales bacterium]|nr:OsmC family protein [Myxococcales bacterium]